eukprot:4814523-Alexandrium_andersonii.AAC.1
MHSLRTRTPGSLPRGAGRSIPRVQCHRHPRHQRVAPGSRQGRRPGPGGMPPLTALPHAEPQLAHGR